MQALLGRITCVTPNEESGPGIHTISFKPICVLPKRTAIPEWLKDQTLKIERKVVDLREVGGPGDSIVLVPEESEKWLYPLTVTPDTAYRELPEKLRLDLRWWKSDNAPDYTIKANGRHVTGKFEKDGERYWVELDTSALFNEKPHLPAALHISCDKIELTCTLLPDDKPFHRKLLSPKGELHRVENNWYSIDITAKLYAGAITGLREKGRGIDHFRAPEDFIQYPLQETGHVDLLRKGWGWYDTKDIAMISAGATREAGATRLQLDGVLDEGQGMRSSVAYSVFDDFPLMLLRRDYRFATPKKPEEDKNKPEAPKEPIDEINSVGLTFRAAWQDESKGSSGSRILCVDHGRLTAHRLMHYQEYVWPMNHKLTQGWVLVEHPLRRECCVYFFDQQSLPVLLSQRGRKSMTLEPVWARKFVRPGDCIGYTLGISVGELCGAGTAGAWVACRALLPDGSIRCAVIARVASGAAGGSAVFTLGGKRAEAPLEKVLAPGIGTIEDATHDFTGASMDDELDVTAAGIAARRRS